MCRTSAPYLGITAAPVGVTGAGHASTEFRLLDAKFGADRFNNVTPNCRSPERVSRCDPIEGGSACNPT